MTKFALNKKRNKYKNERGVDNLIEDQLFTSIECVYAFLKDMPLVRPQFKINNNTEKLFNNAAAYFRTKASKLLNEQKGKEDYSYIIIESINLSQNFNLYTYICELNDFYFTNTYVQNNSDLASTILDIIKEINCFTNEDVGVIEKLKINVETLRLQFEKECNILVKNTKILQEEKQMKRYENLYSSFIYKEIRGFNGNKHAGNYNNNLWLLNYYNMLNELKAKMLFDKESLKNSNFNFFIGIAGLLVGAGGLIVGIISII